MTPTPPAHNGPYSELTADAARDLRRPISPDEVRFKVQAVRWTKRDGQDRVATAAQVVAYIDARTVVARLNLLFPGRWHAPTDALPLDMRLTRRGADGTLTPIRVSDQGEVKADDTLYYRCRLAIGDAAFEDVGAGDDPKAAYSDAIKRAAVRAGIGESLYAMDSPWLRVGDAERPAARQPRRQALPRRAHHPLAAQHVRGVAHARRSDLRRAAPARARPDPARRARDAHRRPAHAARPAADADARRRQPRRRHPARDPRHPRRAGRPTRRGRPGRTRRRGRRRRRRPQTSDAVRRMIAAAHATGVTARTLNRLAVLLAARTPETVLKLEDLDDKLAAELARRVVQARIVGWDDDALAEHGREGAALRAPPHARPAPQGVPRPPRPARDRGALRRGARRAGGRLTRAATAQRARPDAGERDRARSPPGWPSPGAGRRCLPRSPEARSCPSAGAASAPQ